MSIVNGLFAGRAGISSHGSAIAVIGDNISNSSTVGFKASRAEFEDLIAGGQTSGRTIGSGSSLAAVTTIMTQGTLEFTSRPLDLAIDGNGFFVVADGAQRFYSRAGNFKVDSAGFITDQNGFSVLGFPTGGSGALQALNINSVTSSSAATADVEIAGNLDASTSTIAVGAIPPTILAGAGDSTDGDDTTYTQLSNAAEFQTVVEIFDSLGQSHTVSLFFFHTGSNSWTVNAYVDSDDVDPAGDATTGEPRRIGSATLAFGSDGLRTTIPTSPDIDTSTVFAGGGIPWNNGSSVHAVGFTFDPFTQFAANSNINSITQDGQGVGAVTSVNIESNGDIFALLDNGQSTVIGTVALVNFSNTEGLQRIGNNLLQQSGSSGEPIIGSPSSGTFGAVQAGSLELSTVDIANEFVRMITLQRGFQASSRIITTINQLLNEVIQLA